MVRLVYSTGRSRFVLHEGATLQDLREKVHVSTGCPRKAVERGLSIPTGRLQYWALPRLPLVGRAGPWELDFLSSDTHG